MSPRPGVSRLLCLLCVSILFATACSDVDDDLVDVERDDPGAEDGGTAGQGSAGGGDDEPTSTARPAVDLHGPVGSMGAVLLGGEIDRVAVEIERSEGHQLRDGSRSALRAELERSGDTSVEVTGSDTLPDRDVWSSAELRRVGSEHRESAAGPDQVSIQVLVVSGRHEDEGVTGVAVDASTFAVFPEQLGDGLLGGLTASQVEQAVVIHELGHLFGLVDLTGEGAFHEDPNHPGHSDDDGSVMFWAVERDIVSQVFDDGPPTEFDEADREEMDRIRG